MGNALTSCTSGNKEDRAPKSDNAPTDRPKAAADVDNGQVTKDGEGSSNSFVKNVDIRKSLRAARKSITKPFKKTKRGVAEAEAAAAAEEGAKGTEEEAGKRPEADGEEALPVVQVETHAGVAAEDDKGIEVKVDDVEVDDVEVEATAAQEAAKDAEAAADEAAEEGEGKAEAGSDAAADDAADEAAEEAANDDAKKEDDGDAEEKEGETETTQVTDK